MITRYLLVFALLLFFYRGITHLYVHMIENELKDLSLDARPVNHRLTYDDRNIVVSSAKSKSTSSISSPRRATRGTNVHKDVSYSAFRNNNRLVR